MHRGSRGVSTSTIIYTTMFPELSAHAGIVHAYNGILVTKPASMVVTLIMRTDLITLCSLSMHFNDTDFDLAMGHVGHHHGDSERN